MADTPTPPPDPRDAELTDPELFGPRPSDPPDATFVVLELDVVVPYGTKPPSTPIGPFPTRAAAAVHAQAWCDRYGGGSFGVGPLTAPTDPPPVPAAELLDELQRSTSVVALCLASTPDLAAARAAMDAARAELLARLDPATVGPTPDTAVAGMRRRTPGPGPRGAWAHNPDAGGPSGFWMNTIDAAVGVDDDPDPIVRPDGTGNQPYVRRLDADRLLAEFAGLAHQTRAGAPPHVREQGLDATARYNTGLASALDVLRAELMRRMGATSRVGSDYQLAMRRQSRAVTDGHNLYAVTDGPHAVQWVLPEKLTEGADTLIVTLHPVTGP